MLLSFHDQVKLKTKRVIYEETYYAHDSATLAQLRELSAWRKVIEESINGSSNLTEAIAREMSGGITSRVEQDLQKLERYLPLLENLVKQVESVGKSAQILQWTCDLKIRWTSVLGPSLGLIFRGPKFFSINSLRFELCMMLYLYAGLLQEKGMEVLSSDLAQSVQLFKRAAGVYEYVAQDVLPPLQPFLPQERPPEVEPPIASVMALVCLAEAQAVMAKKAEGSGKTPGLISKLHYGVSELAAEAVSILDGQEQIAVSERLMEFLFFSSYLHQARSQRFLALACDSDQLGLAIGILRHAIAMMPKKLPSDESWIAVIKKELDEFNEMLQKLEEENFSFIRHQRPPPMDQLPVLEGRRIVEALPYNPLRTEHEFLFVLKK